MEERGTLHWHCTALHWHCVCGVRLYLSCGLLLPFWLYIERIDGPCIITHSRRRRHAPQDIAGVGASNEVYVCLGQREREMRWHGLDFGPAHTTILFVLLLVPLPPMGSTPPAYHSIPVSSSGLSHRRAVIAILQRKFLVVPPPYSCTPLVTIPSRPPRSQSSPTYPCHMNHHRHHHHLPLLLSAVPPFLVD